LEESNSGIKHDRFINDEIMHRTEVVTMIGSASVTVQIESMYEARVPGDEKKFAAVPRRPLVKSKCEFINKNGK
jgi:hypothetical protein